MSFTKSTTPPQAALVEAAGLRWLKRAEHDGGPPVAGVIAAEHGRLELEEVPSGTPSPEAAEAFGSALARMHRSLPVGTEFGELPDDHPSGVPPLFGPADALFEVGADTYDSWGVFHARERLDPVLERLSTHISMDDASVLAKARNRIASGELDLDEPASRLHGDLWAGNVLWSPNGAVLIDPTAHAGHRESDLAVLQMFGLPHLGTVLGAYDQTWPLTDGWEDRVPVHQLFYLAAHWLLFGSSYAPRTLEAARRAVQYD
ncbi:fructosamine kinase family protein [Nesterenkonia populi]